ncbi:MAG: hypothetical protein DRN49_04385, partial [Thaumarchaeota archaeon]
MQNKLSAHITTSPIIIIVITTLIIPICLNIKTYAQTQTTVYIEPQSTSTLINEVFSVNLTIADVTDLCSWQAYIYYQNDILQVVGYEEGPFLKSHGSTMFDAGYDNNYNETHGEIWMYCIRTWSGTGVNGSGVLATIDFKAIGGGTTTLHLANTILGNSTAQPIPHVTVDGDVEVFGGDIAIINVKTSKTIVGQGYSMNINVTVENQGTTAETFNLTVYANTSEIETKQITLDSNTSTIITFTWNTASFVKGNYTIRAYAHPILGETDTADNSLVMSSVISVVMPGDANLDGVITILDVCKVTGIYGAKKGDQNYNPNVD